MTMISVIIPAYNQGKYLDQAIQSVLDQTYPDFEIIVVDDGSTDATPDIVRSYLDSRVQYIYQENQGLSAARNTGIRCSKGSFLSFLDSDDLFMPNKLALLVDVLNQQPEVGLVAGQSIPIDENGNPAGEIFNKALPDKGHLLLLGNPLHVGSVLLRRSMQEKVGYFDETLRSYEDWDMWLRLARIGCQMAWVPKPVSMYRFHTSQMTRLGTQMTDASFAVLDKVFRDTTLPNAWWECHDIAYSNAYLRAAAQAYNAQDFKNGKAYLMHAVTLDPDLVINNADPLARQFSAWTDLPKTGDRLEFLEGIYNHLPEQIPVLHHRRRHDLSLAAQRLVYESFNKGNPGQTIRAMTKAAKYQPSWLGKRGTMAILVRSVRSLILQD